MPPDFKGRPPDFKGRPPDFKGRPPNFKGMPVFRVSREPLETLKTFKNIEKTMKISTFLGILRLPLKFP